MATKFPVLFMALEGPKDGQPADAGWDEGLRLKIEHIDFPFTGDCHFFKDRKTAEDFMAIHSMYPETLKRVQEMRTDMAKQRKT